MVVDTFLTSQPGSTTDKPASKEETNDPKAAEENIQVEEEIKET